MRHLSLVVLAIVLVVPPALAGEWTAPKLAETMASRVEDGHSTARIKMTSPDTGVLQLKIKSRRTSGNFAIVYEILWPTERKGEAFILRQSGTGPAQGAVRTGGGDVTKLGGANLAEPAFGTALAFADTIENFFRWENQELAGTEKVGKAECLVLESRPGGPDASIYGKVRSWIDPQRLVTLRVEKYGKAGSLLRRIETTQVAKDDKGRHIPAGMSVQSGGKTTEIDGANIRHDVTHADAEFAF